MFELIIIAGAAIAVLALILWGRRPDPYSGLAKGIHTAQDKQSPCPADNE